MEDKGLADMSSSTHEPLSSDSRTALEIVSQMLQEVRQLKQDTPTSRAAGESLHVLDSLTASRLGFYSLDAVQPSSVSLSKDSCTENLAIISRAASQLRSAFDISDAPPLLQELSTQASEVTYATQGTTSLAACLKDAWKSFPSALWTGSLSQKSTPTADHADAVAVLDALCHAMTPIATKLRLESFHERIEMPDADAPSEKIMTFTIGGRIIVLDLELSLCRKHDLWTPLVGLHISYATGDASDLSDYNKRLEDMLCAWLQQLMHVLFGLEVDPRVLARCQPCEENTPLAQGMRLWNAFVSSLATLAFIDGINVESKEDLFQCFASLCALSEDVCLREARTLASQYGRHLDLSVSMLEQPDMVELLQRYGHGVCVCHHQSPYLSLAFTPHHTATVRIIPASIPFESDQEPMAMLARSVVDMPEEANQLWRVQGHYSDQPTRALAYIAELSPPMAIPHSMARAVYLACGLASQQLATTPGETQAGFLKQNMSSTSFYKPSLHDEEVRNVSALPFQCLTRLFRALEILQECSQWTSVIQGTKSDTSARPVCTLQLEPGSEQGTCRLRLHTTATHAPATRIHATLWPMLTNRVGWEWEAQAMRWDGTLIASTHSKETTLADETYWPDSLVLTRIRDILDAWVGTL